MITKFVPLHPKPSLSKAWDGMDQTRMLDPMVLLARAAPSAQTYVLDPFHPKPCLSLTWDGVDQTVMFDPMGLLARATPSAQT